MGGLRRREYHEELMAAIARGASVPEAARAAGVSTRTVERWLARNRVEVEAGQRRALLGELAQELGEVFEEFLLAARKVVSLADRRFGGSGEPAAARAAPRPRPFVSLLGGKHEPTRPTAA